jgi:hypothetical protein
MASWKDVAAAEARFAERVRRTFAIRKHATLATLRRDGSPRISGAEVEFDESGEIHLGMMPGSRKALDLRRDPRLALHCPTEDPPQDAPGSWLGDGKIAGLAVEVSDPRRADQAHRFRVDITEVVLTTVGDPADHLVIQSWHPGRGLERHERR